MSKDTPKALPDDTHLLTYKVAKVEGLSLFCDWIDYFDPRQDFFDLDKLLNTVDPNAALTYFHDLLNHEFSEKAQNNHKYILHNFKLELQLQINKDIRNPLAPATLKHPQLKANLIIGELDINSR